VIEKVVDQPIHLFSGWQRGEDLGTRYGRHLGEQQTGAIDRVGRGRLKLGFLIIGVGGLERVDLENIRD